MNSKPHSIFAAIAVAALAVCTSGCATVHTSSLGVIDGIELKGAPEGAVQMVYVHTKGYYFLWCVPLASGDIRWNDEKKSIEGGTSFFKDQVGLGELQSALMKIAESRDCDLAEVYYRDSDTTYAGVSYGGAIGACFGSSQMCVSALLVPRRTSAK